jgi:hypothetical protein
MIEKVVSGSTSGRDYIIIDGQIIAVRLKGKHQR